MSYKKGEIQTDMTHSISLGGMGATSLVPVFMSLALLTKTALDFTPGNGREQLEDESGQEGAKLLMAKKESGLNREKENTNSLKDFTSHKVCLNKYFSLDDHSEYCLH